MSRGTFFLLCHEMGHECTGPMLKSSTYLVELDFTGHLKDTLQCYKKLSSQPVSFMAPSSGADIVLFLAILLLLLALLPALHSKHQPRKMYSHTVST